jgi:hypothetical protein
MLSETCFQRHAFRDMLSEEPVFGKSSHIARYRDEVVCSGSSLNMPLSRAPTCKATNSTNDYKTQFQLKPAIDAVSVEPAIDAVSVETRN